jgi:pentose-5-phosphate-3-epimerase
MQMVFFMTDRMSSSSQKREEENSRKVQELDQYVVTNGRSQRFEVVIDNRNQEVILRQMNAYVFQKKIRRVSISF